MSAQDLIRKKTNRAVFIDRDGTMAKDVPYCSRPQDFNLLPGVADGIKALNKHGFKVVVITNQSGIARGYFTEQTLSEIHNKMIYDLSKHNAHIDAIYYCPHHPDDNCQCRKPKPELVFIAASDLGLNISASYVIGDKELDCELASYAGCKAAVKIAESGKTTAHYRTPSFKEAVKWIIKDSRNVN